MNFKACLVLSLAVLVLAVCVSADRAHVERVKGAPKHPGRTQHESKGAEGKKEFSKFLDAIKATGSRLECEECVRMCLSPEYCGSACTADDCKVLCCQYVSVCCPPA